MIDIIYKLLESADVSMVILPPLDVVALDELKCMSEIEVAEIIACYSFLVAQGLSVPSNEYGQYLHSLRMATQQVGKGVSPVYMEAVYNAIHVNYTGLHGYSEHLRCLSWFINHEQVVESFMGVVGYNLSQLKQD